jgi:hypothetical protein
MSSKEQGFDRIISSHSDWDLGKGAGTLLHLRPVNRLSLSFVTAAIARVGKDEFR